MEKVLAYGWLLLTGYWVTRIYGEFSWAVVQFAVTLFCGLFSAALTWFFFQLDAQGSNK